MTIANNNELLFSGPSPAGNTRLINSGEASITDFSGTVGPGGDGKVSADSIAGTIILGRRF